ncbi:MAG: AarF/ABC1/UbiB kinase family protein [Oligoflexus sp.]|nr:AarF/ABC1/UbiB kinase family protein [Oligoflexus sp.]
MTTEKTLKKIRSGLFDRSLSLTKLAVQSGAHLAMTGIKGAFSDSDGRDAHFKALINVQARLLTSELGRLKGSLMKVGQMLALYGEHFLPEEVVSQLKSLNEQSISVEWKEIDRLLRQRLSPEALADLEIDQKPLAAASMGQVHRAVCKKTGEELCIKIQYPGVDEAIDSDVKALRSILSLLKLMPSNNKAFDELFEEIRSMLHQELDYKKELAFTNEACGLVASDPRFIVPRTFPQYSAERLLTTSFEHGVNIDSPEVLVLSEERRSRIAVAFCEMFMRELFEFRMMQTDPHFGNFKIRLGADAQSDQIILLDWGAVRRFDEVFLKNYRQMIDGAFEMDQKKIIEAAFTIGFLNPDASDKLLKSFAEICFLAVEPWLPPQDPRVPSHLVDRNGCYIWSKSDLPTRIAGLATKYAISFRVRAPPREVLFLDRKIGGIFIMMKVLDARFQGHKLVDKFFRTM